jgi:hypothetical protein
MILSASTMVTAACGGHAGPAPATAAPTTARTVPMAGVYLLQMSGTPPPDTTVSLVAGTPRHILFRTARPDNTVLADVYFGSQAFQAPPGSSVTISLRPSPGMFGLILESTSPFQQGGEITFKYAVHFQAPADVTAKYPNHLLLEHALAVGRLGAADQIDLLPSVRPAADNLRAPAAAPGTYVVAAPR